jgi:cell division protein ZipA
MSELRLSLLALGIGFLLGLVAWEWWRRRLAAAQARRDSAMTGIAAAEHADNPAHDRLAAAPSIGPVGRDPVLGSLPMVDVGEQLDSQIQADVDRYGLADADTVVLDTADFEKPPEVRVEWPEETQRQILGLRVVARPGTRFSGMRVRQALVGDGYVYGEMRIFHRAGVDGRVILSAANLNKPGYFELDKLDSQTFSGLNLFAVLPGPLPAVQTFELLLGSARSLAQRLGGDMAETSGARLTDERTLELRAGLRDAAPLQRAAGAD